MEVNHNPEMHDWVLERLREERQKPKPSPHATQLIYCLTSSYHDLIDPLPLTEKEILMFSVGFGMERLMLGKYEDHPVKKDGIYVSPDLSMSEFAADPSEGGELKTTRGRPPGPGGILDIPEGWKKQIMAGCHVLGVLQYNLAVVHIVQPALSTWHLKFNLVELEDNWEWIKSRLVTLMDFMSKGEVPTPFKHNMEWECNWCRYKPRCDLSRMASRSAG